MRGIVKKLAIGAGVALVGAGSAQASVIGTTGAMDYISTPWTIMPGELQSNTLIRFFDEPPQGKVLPFNLSAEITAPGSYTGTSLIAPSMLGVLSAGIKIDSYMFHFDNAANNSVAYRAEGTVTFSQDILGVMVGRNSLDVSDMLGLFTWYPVSATAGLEASDAVGISSNRRTLSLSLLTTGQETDRLRVITAAPTPPLASVDEPTPLLLLGLGTIIIGIAVRRGKKGRTI